jgi:catechol 2,3-dioxygenase-like lactoylglutathione lyase family enzyme
MLRTLDHVILAVRDLEAASRSYSRLLGRGVSWRGEHPAAGTTNALFRLENTYLELLAPAGPGPVAEALQAWLEGRGEGPVGLAFGTDDAEACRTWLAERGLAPQAIEKGLGRDLASGAYREWRRVPIPLSGTRGVLLFAIEHRSPSELLTPSGPAGEEAAVVYALDHAVIRTADAEAARALYGEGLGLRLALDREFAQWGMRLLFFRIGGITVELAAQLGAKPDPNAPDRFWGLSYRVRDADAARKRLAGEGFDVSEVRPGRKPGTRVFSVRDGTHGVPTLMLQPGETARA